MTLREGKAADCSSSMLTCMVLPQGCCDSCLCWFPFPASLGLCLPRDAGRRAAAGLRGQPAAAAARPPALAAQGVGAGGQLCFPPPLRRPLQPHPRHHQTAPRIPLELRAHHHLHGTPGQQASCCPGRTQLLFWWNSLHLLQASTHGSTCKGPVHAKEVRMRSSLMKQEILRGCLARRT